MKLSKAIKIFFDYHQNHSKPNTIRSNEAILTKFDLTLGDKELKEISSEDILTFLGKITDGRLFFEHNPREIGATPVKC